VRTQRRSDAAKVEGDAITRHDIVTAGLQRLRRRGADRPSDYWRRSSCRQATARFATRTGTGNVWPAIMR